MLEFLERQHHSFFLKSQCPVRSYTLRGVESVKCQYYGLIFYSTELSWTAVLIDVVDTKRAIQMQNSKLT